MLYLIDPVIASVRCRVFSACNPKYVPMYGVPPDTI